MTSMKRNEISPLRANKGFALIATLSLMVLLIMLLVAMLSLTSVSLRDSGQNEPIIEARANARMALKLAIGELQKNVGPDRAVTATSEILATSSTTVSKPNTTGVWESWWDFDPSASPNYSAEKTNRFQGWLVSSADATAPKSLDFASTPWTGNTIELVGEDSLGATAPDDDKVTAGLIPISNNDGIQGSFAWHVADESVKARVNLYRDPSQNTTLSQKRALLAGHRPDPSVLKSADGNLLSTFPTDLTPADFVAADASASKILNLNQAELLDGAEGKIKPFRNDITPYSLGVMTDVRGGGLKEDLSSVFEMGSATQNTLPSVFTKERLYQSTHGITGVSDPYWSALAGYYNSFRNLDNPNTNPTFATASDAATLDPVPTGYNPAPVIAKVDTIFSLVSRPITETWLGANGDQAKNYDCFTDVVFTPVVTLHNPYNVNISFNRINVTFKNIPIAFRFMVQYGDLGSSYLSRSVVPENFESLNEMVHHLNYRGDKEFGMNIANWSDSDPIDQSDSISEPIVMKPGQTLVCGPYVDPNASFKKDSGLGRNTVAFDWQNKLINKIKARPEFVPGLGFEVYSVNLSSLFKQVWNEKGHSWNSFFMLRDQNTSPKVSQTTTTDQFYVEFKAQRPRWQLDQKPVPGRDELVDPSFTVTAQLQAQAGDAMRDYARLQFDYQDDSTIGEVFDDRVYRYPPTSSLTVSDTYCPEWTTYSEQGIYVHPFAIFSAYTRTTNGGVYETGKRDRSEENSPLINILQDGRLAGKPYLFHNPSQSNFTLDLTNEKPGVQAYELNFQPFLSKGDYQDYMDVDANNRVPSLSGNNTTSGIKSGSYLEIPSGPLQTIADFRRSNALTTSYLPHFVQPVGNSLLHPLMSSDTVIELDTTITANALLDHSVLANHALYDNFYFSTFATRGSETPDDVYEQFMNGTTPLASQAFEPYLPVGKTVATAKAELFTSGKPNDTAYQTAAEYQMIRGPFNVNSTSVQAWKAVLASMNKSGVVTLWARSAGLEVEAADGVPITAMSLLNGGENGIAAVDSAKIDNQRTNDWNGYRVLTESELENLAEKIVDEVRERGPFLSMSEFVNRQVGLLSPKTLSGALESAITKSEINEDNNATSLGSFMNQVPITATDISDPKLYAYKTPQASTGNPAAGAPGWVNQGDLLRILEPGATVRGDTFVIRVYGDAQDPSGNITARAYAEAVVQRVPEYLNPVDRPSINAYTDTTAAAANKTFGRRIKVVTFRWLSDNEI